MEVYGCEMEFEIPVIDLSGLYDGHEGINHVAQQIKKRFKTVGFSYLINSGISESLIKKILAAAKAFHKLSLEKKLKIKQNQAFRGYLAPNASKVKSSTQGSAKHPNLVEAFIMMFEADESNPDYKEGKYLAGPNQWPDEMPELKEVMIEYRDAMVSLSQRLVKAFAVAFGLAEHALDGMFLDPTYFLRLHRYQPQERSDADRFGLAPHTDIGFMTCLVQDDIGGLQVRAPETGEWVNVAYKPGALILNAGDMLQRLTNGEYKPVVHRVLNSSGKDRYSVPFFFDPNMHAQIESLAPFVKDGSVQCESFMYGDYVMGRVTPNYAILQGKAGSHSS